jgi:hypothetical protein
MPNKPVARCVSRGYGCDETKLEASFSAAIRTEKEQEGDLVNFTGDTLRSNLRGIPSPKIERARRMWIPTASFCDVFQVARIVRFLAETASSTR